jgi:hypothetical protein
VRADHAEGDLAFVEEADEMRARYVQQIGGLLRRQLGVNGTIVTALPFAIWPRISRKSSKASRGTVAETGRPSPSGRTWTVREGARREVRQKTPGERPWLPS